MKTHLLLSSVLVLATLAGCATNTDEVDDGMAATTPASGTPAASTPPASTPAMTPATHEPADGGAPPMMECTGDYVTEDSNETHLGMPVLAFTAKDPDAADPCYAFVGPAQATAGWNVIRLTYPPTGHEFHIMPMFFVGEHTMDEVIASFAAEAEPEWAIPVGAVGGLTPGQTASVAMELQEGNYVYICPINGHMMQGMIGMLRVSASETPAAEPTADLDIDLVDYNFTIPSEVPASTKIIKVTNKGSEPHEAPLVLLDENTTVMQFLGAIEDPNATAPPPGALIGGVNVIAPGESVYLLVDLVAGRHYGMACFFESEAHGGAPHLALGMTAEFVAT